jgi:carbon storage regulator
MLVLARHVEEEIVINGNIRIKVLEIQGNQVRLGIIAPREVAVYRREIYDHIAQANQAAAEGQPALLSAALRRAKKTAQEQ